MKQKAGRGPRRVWWATWPGALCMGLIGLVLSAPGAMAGLIWVLIPDNDSSGLDFEVAAPPVWMEVLAFALPVVAVVAFLLTVYWARKRWAGYLLLGLGVSLIAGIIGLVFQGIL